MIFLPRQGAADAEGGLKGPAHLRRSLQGFGGGWPPTSTRWVYTRALLATRQGTVPLGVSLANPNFINNALS